MPRGAAPRPRPPRAGAGDRDALTAPTLTSRTCPGYSAPLFLARFGVRSLLVDRHPGVSIQGRAPRTWPDLTAGQFCMADQSAVEPLLVDAARAHGADQRFNTELLSLDADPNGVIAVVA